MTQQNGVRTIESKIPELRFYFKLFNKIKNWRVFTKLFKIIKGAFISITFFAKPYTKIMPNAKRTKIFAKQ